MIEQGYYSIKQGLFATFLFTGPVCSLMLSIGCTEPGSHWFMPLAIIGYLFGAGAPWVLWARDKYHDKHKVLNIDRVDSYDDSCISYYTGRP